MENLIGWTLVLVLIVMPMVVVFGLYKRHRKTQQAYQDNLDRYQVEVKALHDREKERWRQAALKPSTTDITKYPKVHPASGGGGASYTRSYASSATALPETTSTVRTSDDSILQDLAMMYVLNTALEHGSSHAQIDYDKKSVTVDTPSRSDDEDSRVVTDTFSSSSDSSSSWSSSDSSSSSDVSSDW